MAVSPGLKDLRCIKNFGASVTKGGVWGTMVIDVGARPDNVLIYGRTQKETAGRKGVIDTDYRMAG